MKSGFKYVREVCLGGIFLLLFLPLAQSTFNLKKWVRPLKGAYEEKQDTALTLQTWFSERFQQKKNDYLNQHFGFHNYYVLLNNQVDFSLFKKANASHVIIGKHNFLFEDDYINAYYGKNFLGEEKIKERFAKLKKAQELLRKQGILLEIVFSPGKASFYPEYIPEYAHGKKKESNYEAMCRLAKEEKVHVVDFNGWFQKIKYTSLYDLYPRGGIHWSNYGALIAMDSLRKDIEASIRVKMNSFVVKEVNFSDSLIEPDNDIADALNLFTRVKPLPMPYAKYDWVTEGAVKPRALFIGDSYFWNWYYQGLVNNIFDNATFWYYNQTVYPESEKIRAVAQLSFKDEVMKQRVVVLMATESNIQDIGWGFVDKVLAEFKDGVYNRRKEIYVSFFQAEIQKSADWLGKVKEKAVANKVSLEEMLRKDAEYLYETEYNTPKVVSYTEEVKKRIEASPEWLAHVRAKAHEKNVPEDEMIELDAKYVYDTEVKDKK